MKVLVTILNFNLPEYTDVVYESLEPYQNNLYDIMVMDNGSTEEGKSKYTTHETGKNVYFGGGLNITFQYMLDHKEYDYLLFLNNDILMHGNKFVESLVRVAEGGNTIVSPCILHPEQEQNYWIEASGFKSLENYLDHKIVTKYNNQFFLKNGYGIIKNTSKIDPKLMLDTFKLNFGKDKFIVKEFNHSKLKIFDERRIFILF